MVQKSRRRPPGHIMWGIEMKKLFPLLGALALVVTPAMAGDEKSKESTEQSAAQEKDRAPLKKPSCLPRWEGVRSPFIAPDVNSFNSSAAV